MRNKASNVYRQLYNKCVTITVIDTVTEIPFAITFYDLTEHDLGTVGPGEGGAYVMAALARRGLDPGRYLSSPFWIWIDGKRPALCPV